MIVGLEISSDFGHFSHPSTIYSSLSYPLPPKTTIIGMLGAIMGEDEYLFLNDIKYSCIIKNLDGKRNFCFNGVKDILKELRPEKAGAGFSKRKQFYRELLINPVYEIYIDISKLANDKKDKLLLLLKEHKSIYPIYMGVNFCLSTYNFLGTFEFIKKRADKIYIDSFIPLDFDFELEDGKNYTDVRFATTIQNGRIFGGFRDFLVEISSKSILCKNVEFLEINKKRVIFV